MASPVPAKSQPLHNFDLPRTLKWNKDGKSSNNHHRRRSIKSPSRRPNPSPASPLRHSPLRDSISATHPPHRQDYSVKSSPIRGDLVNRLPIRVDPVSHFPRSEVSGSETSGKSQGVVIEYRRNHHSKNPDLDGVNSVKSERVTLKSEKKPKSTDVDLVGIKRSSKILIKIPCKNSNDKLEEENLSNKTEEKTPMEEPSEEGNHTDQVQEEGKNENNGNGIDEEAKTWNLRPRKPIRKSLNVNGGGIAVKNNGSAMADKGKPQSPSKNVNTKSGENEGHGCGVEKEKRKLSVDISLMKDEIEEDIYAFTGLKPAKRPKKRPRNVQKQVDFVFPGLWLVSITPDSYKVSENSMKG